jgi:dTDP-4-dehydrorhamnose reductase
MSDKIILTGATGLFGTNFIKCTKNINNLIFWGNKKKIKLKNIKIQYINLKNYSLVEKQISKLRPKTIIHAAAFTDVDDCEKNIYKAYSLNVSLTKNLVLLCKKYKIKMIYLSSDQIFSGNKKIYNEKSKIDPINIYGLTKSLGESIIVDQLKQYLILRTNFFGIGTRYRNSLSDFIIRNLRLKKKIFMYKNVYFNPLNVESLIQYILRLNKLNLKGIFNLGSDQKISKYKFALQIANEFKLDKEYIEPINIEKKINIAKRPLNMFLDNSKFKKNLKINKIPIKNQISDLRRAYERNR